MAALKDNSGALFRNDRKEKDTHPDYKGTITVNGVEFWISGWLNESQKGVKYMGLSVQEKQEAHNNGVKQASAAFVDDVESDSIPF